MTGYGTGYGKILQKDTFSGETGRKGRSMISRIIDGEILNGCNVGTYPRHHFSRVLLRDVDRTCPFYVTFAGDDENNRGFWRHRPNSRTFSLELLVSGEFLLTQNEKTFHCHPWDVFIVHKERDVRFECISDYAFKRTIIMDGPMLYFILSALGLDQRTCVVRLSNPERVDALFQKVGTLCAKQDAGLNNTIFSTAYEILLELQQIRLRREIPEKLAVVLELLEKSLLHPFSIEDLAKGGRISERTLFHLFARHLNTTPLQYITERRISYAKLLLRNYDTLIKTVAYECGYSDAHYFSRDFKKQTGFTPVEYRNRCQRGEI